MNLNPKQYVAHCVFQVLDTLLKIVTKCVTISNQKHHHYVTANPQLNP